MVRQIRAEIGSISLGGVGKAAAPNRSIETKRAKRTKRTKRAGRAERYGRESWLRRSRQVDVQVALEIMACRSWKQHHYIRSIFPQQVYLSQQSSDTYRRFPILPSLRALGSSSSVQGFSRPKIPVAFCGIGKTLLDDMSSFDKRGFPVVNLSHDGWSNEDEATATCFCGAVQLVLVSQYVLGPKRLLVLAFFFLVCRLQTMSARLPSDSDSGVHELTYIHSRSKNLA